MSKVVDLIKKKQRERAEKEYGTFEEILEVLYKAAELGVSSVLVKCSSDQAAVKIGNKLKAHDIKSRRDFNFLEIYLD